MTELVPKQENSVRNRIKKNLVILPDMEFSRLLDRGLPVQARIKLTSAKTTSKYEDEKGNLWYEESVPADSLFIFFLMNRPGRVAKEDMVDEFLRVSRKEEDSSATIQLGGNETVGYGWCLQQMLSHSSTLAYSQAREEGNDRNR